MYLGDRLCMNCIHRSVCSIKENYDELYNHIENFDRTVEYDESILNLFHVNISCKNYYQCYNTLGNIKLMGGTE